MMTQESDLTEAHKELLALWLETEPDATWSHCPCGVTWRLRYGGLICPNCGRLFVTEQEAIVAVKERLRQRAEKEAATVAAEVEPGRDDPPGLDDVIGNVQAVLQIRTAIEAYHARCALVDCRTKAKPVLPHFLLTGPSGLGKTTLAYIISREIKARVHLELGQTLNNPAKVCEVLRSLKAHDILFIDEIHGMSNQSQESLYLAMEDRILIPPTRAGKPSNESKPIRLPPFTLIGATTDAWGLLPPLQRRFRYRVRLMRMSSDELSRAMMKRADKKGIKMDEAAAKLIGERALGRPGMAVNLLDMCADTAVAQKSDLVTEDIVEITCGVWLIDRRGLDRDSTDYLRCLGDATGPRRLNVIAAMMEGLAKTTLERNVEPDLLYLGLISKLPNGRILTDAGREYVRKNGLTAR